MNRFFCTIPGDPRGKGSVRVYNRHAVKDAKTESYMGRAIFAMTEARAGTPTRDGVFDVEINAYLRRPASLIPKARARTEQPPAGAFPAWCKPDADNIAKIILDCLTQSGVINDDKRVAVLVVRKWWAPVDGDVRVDVVVEQLFVGWPPCP